MESFIINLIATVLGQMSPVIRESVNLWLDDMQKQAAETPNPWDDIFVLLLRVFLGARSGTDTGDKTDTRGQEETA